MKSYIYIIGVMLLLCHTGCEDTEKVAMESLMQEIRDDYAQKRYDECLVAIDTLRARYPKAVAERREALEIFQKASLEQAQQQLATVDSMLIAANARLQTMHKTVDAHKAAGVAVARELTDVTFQRMHRDSLQVQFDVLCAKIKYIHKRQKQLKDEE